MSSPQAMLPSFKPWYERSTQPRSMKDNVMPPRIIDLVANTSTTVFDSRVAGVYGDKKPVRKLVLHNLGITALKYAINTDAKAGDFHGILAGGNVADDGLGSQVDLSVDSVEYVSVFSPGAAGKVAVYVSNPQDVLLGQ